MKCQFCDNPATVHLTDIVNKKKREVHLCEGCARKHNLIPDQAVPQIDLKALLNLLVGPFHQAQAAAADPAALTCPACGLQYAEFRAEGRLGCPADYDAFRATLEPLLERVHRSVRHAGKVPRAFRRLAREAELRGLGQQLRAAVAAEEYEEAARLRDLIRQKEGSDEPR
jgi:protein arginine kinase activator